MKAGSLEKTIQTISRKGDGRLKAFLRLAQVGGFSTNILIAMANQFGVKGSALVGNLPRTEDLPQDIQRLVKTSSGRPHIATFIRDEIKRLFQAYSKNPQLIVSKAPSTAQQAAKPSEPKTPSGDSAPSSGLKSLKPAEVMVALNQMGLRQGSIKSAAKKALANRGLTKTDRENIEAVAKQLISYLEGGLKESKIIVGPAAMRMIEELYENRWKEIAGIK